MGIAKVLGSYFLVGAAASSEWSDGVVDGREAAPSIPGSARASRVLFGASPKIPPGRAGVSPVGSGVSPESHGRAGVPARRARHPASLVHIQAP